MKRSRVKFFVLNENGHDLTSIKKRKLVDESEDEQLQEPVKVDVVPERESECGTEPLEDEASTGEIVETTTTSKSVLTLRKTVQQYIKWFPKKLKDFETGQLCDMDEEQLKLVLESIRFQLSASNSASFNKLILDTGIGITENVGISFGFKVNGLSNLIHNHEEVDDVLKEIALINIEKGWYIENPYQRLGLIILSEGSRLHQFNIQQETMGLLRSKFVSQKIIDKYKNL